MKRLIIARIIIIAAFSLFASATFSEDSESVTVAPSQGEFTTVDGVHTIEQLQPNGLRRVVKVWPSEVSLGDSIYFCCYDYNVSGTPFTYQVSESNSDQTLHPFCITLEASLNVPGITTIQSMRSTPTVLSEVRSPNCCDIRPGEKLVLLLDNWKTPIPTRDQYTSLFADSNEILCELCVSMYGTYKNGARTEKANVYKLPIRLKQRDENELRLIEYWRKLSIKLKQNVRAPRLDQIPTSSFRDPISVKEDTNWKLRSIINPDFDYSHPNSDIEWAEVENQLQPCVLRDEISFARMLVSYFNEKDDEKASSKRKEFVSWFMELPEPLYYDRLERLCNMSYFVTPLYNQRCLQLLIDILSRQDNKMLRTRINSAVNFVKHDKDDPNSFVECYFAIDPSLRLVLELWPVTVKLGDPVYCRYYVKNFSDSTVKNYPIANAYPTFKTSRIIPEAIYRKPTLWMIENTNRALLSQHSKAINELQVLTTRDIHAGESSNQLVASWRLPPAEQLCLEFWTSLFRKPHNHTFKIDVQNVCYFLKGLDDNYNSQFAQVESFNSCLWFTVIPRANSELDLLKDWGAKASAVDQASISKLAEAHPDDLVGAFLRLGNPFPHYPNAPDTVDGWKSLEEQIEPSAMRDEITFCRMIIEYYDEKDDETAAKLLKSLSEWLESRPAPQRFGLIESIHYGQYGEETNEVYKARRQALAELFDQLTDGVYSERLKNPPNAQAVEVRSW